MKTIETRFAGIEKEDGRVALVATVAVATPSPAAVRAKVSRRDARAAESFDRIFRMDRIFGDAASSRVSVGKESKMEGKEEVRSADAARSAVLFNPRKVSHRAAGDTESFRQDLQDCQDLLAKTGRFRNFAHH
ncbi:MAG: hypothetical protein IJS32_07750 [Kiritimatiellae bacterium]|nr:hypothetical protein [Kiritimatiellia bacterium]